MGHRKADKHTHASFEGMHTCTVHKLHRILGMIRHDGTSHKGVRNEMMWQATVFELAARTVEAWVQERATTPRAKLADAVVRKELRMAFAVAHGEMTQRHAEMNGRLGSCTLADLLLVHQPVKMSAFMVNCLPDKYSRFENRLLAALAAVTKKSAPAAKRRRRPALAVV